MSARAFAFIVQSKCLSSVSSAGRATPVAALWTSTSSGPSALHLLGDLRRRDVAADERHVGAECLDLARRLLGRPVVSEVADRDPRRALLGEAAWRSRGRCLASLP